VQAKGRRLRRPFKFTVILVGSWRPIADISFYVFPDELYPAPRSWAQRAYPKLIHYNTLDKGGHFAAWEQPRGSRGLQITSQVELKVFGAHNAQIEFGETAASGLSSCVSNVRFWPIADMS
jgi:hypothetical protein